MFNPNIPSFFFTSPKGEGRGTDVYGVHSSGLIIAKTDSNKLKVRPRQNLYFIREKDIDAFRLLREPNISFVNGSFFIYRPHNYDILLTLKPDAFFNIPVHLSLRSDGLYDGGERCGHPVVFGFNGTCSTLNTVFTLVQVILAICMHWYDMDYGDYQIDNNPLLQLTYAA